MILSHSAIFFGSSAYWLRTKASIFLNPSAFSEPTSFAIRKHCSLVRLNVTSRLCLARLTLISPNLSSSSPSFIACSSFLPHDVRIKREISAFSVNSVVVHFELEPVARIDLTQRTQRSHRA